MTKPPRRDELARVGGGSLQERDDATGASVPDRFVFVAVTKIVLLYAGFAALWILLTDQLVAQLFTAPGHLAMASIAKGWFFVVVTAALLGGLLRHYLNALAAKEAALRESQAEKIRSLQLIEAIVDGTSDIVIAYDMDGACLLFNKAAEKATGRRADEVLGHRGLGMPGSDLLARRREAVLLHGETLTSEEAWVFPDGEAHTVLTTEGPVRSGDGQTVGSYVIGRDISDRKHAETILASEHRKARTLMHLASDGICILDVDGNVEQVNNAFARLLGCAHDDLLTMNAAQWTDRWAAFDTKALIDRIRHTQDVLLFETQHRRCDGDRIDVEISATAIDIDGRPLLYCAVRDISERKRADAHERLAARVFETAAEAILVTDAAANIVAVNPAFSRITGFSEDEVIGVNPRILKSGRHDKSHYEAMWRSLIDTGGWSGEVWNRRKNGEVYPEWLAVSGVRDAGGRLTNYVAIFTDLSEIRRAQEAAEQLSWNDLLTGLGNRALFIRQLDQKLQGAIRDGRFASILLLDLDRFKDINEARGLVLGDALLRTVAEQLSQALDGDAVVARLGSDEFAVLLPSLCERAEEAALRALAVAERLRSLLRTRISLNAESFHLDASIGIALFPTSHQETASDVLRDADTAMHQAKIEGGHAVFFETAMAASVTERYQLERELRRAVHDGQLRVYLQLQVNAAGRAVGAEALVRWQHPERGLIPPATFVPLAEASDIIVDIDRWMLAEACHLLARMNIEGRALQIAVNISPRHFKKRDFVDAVRQLLAVSGADPRRLVLEVTEGLVIGDVADAVDKMALLTALGVRISMDDFGTGYSSLAYLKRLPIHELKIDKSFIQDAPTDPSDAALVEAILAVARHLNLQVVAEGVETQAQADFLNARAQVIQQGYLYGRPEPLEEALRKLRA